MDAGVEAPMLLAILRTQDDVSVAIATYLSLPELFNAVQCCRTAMRSAFRQQLLRTTRLELVPDTTRAQGLVQGMDTTICSIVKHVAAADMRSIEHLEGKMTGVQTLRLQHHRYMLRDSPSFTFIGLQAFAQLKALNLSNLSELDDVSGIEVTAASLQYLDLSRTAVGDITPLFTLRQLVELNLASTPIWSIAPLTGMAKLSSLDLSYTSHVHDLSPLRALSRLRKLSLNNKSIVRLDTLAYIAENLEHVEISEANVQSISLDDREDFLRALVNCRHLNLSWSRFIPRLDSLAQLHKLRVLNLAGEKFPDLTPLSTLLALEEVSIKQDIDIDLSILGTLHRLRNLFIDGLRPHINSMQFLSQLEDLDTLHVSSLYRLGMPTLPKLKELKVSVLTYSEYFKYPTAPQIERLTVCTRVEVNQLVAKYADLRHLYLEDVDRIGLHSLVQLKQLESLEIGRKGSQAQPFPEDHSFLRPLTQLRKLLVHWTTLSDLFVLTGMTQLEELSLEGTPVADVWHITALTSLQVLSIADTRVRSVGDLTVLPRLRQVTLPKHASCSPLLDAFHSSSALPNLKYVYHPSQNCLWGQHRSNL